MNLFSYKMFFVFSNDFFPFVSYVWKEYNC